jgi:hypothetical protein
VYRADRASDGTDGVEAANSDTTPSVSATPAQTSSAARLRLPDARGVLASPRASNRLNLAALRVTASSRSYLKFHRRARAGQMDARCTIDGPSRRPHAPGARVRSRSPAPRCSLRCPVRASAPPASGLLPILAGFALRSHSGDGVFLCPVAPRMRGPEVSLPVVGVVEIEWLVGLNRQPAPGTSFGPRPHALSHQPPELLMARPIAALRCFFPGRLTHRGEGI